MMHVILDGKWVQGVWFPHIFREPKLGTTNIGESVMVPANITPEGGTVEVINIDELIEYLEKINEDWDRARGLQKAEVRVKPYARQGKFVIGYTRTDPREKHERPSEEAAKDYVAEVKNIAKERNFDIEVVEVSDWGDKMHLEFYLWEKGAQQVMKKYKEKTPGLMGRIEMNYYHEGGEPQWKKKGYISAIFLKDEFQSGGLGTDIVKRFVDTGVKHGYKEFEMLANGDVGVYAWPMQGFNWTTLKEAKSMRANFCEWLKINYNHRAAPEDFPNAWDIASFKIGDEKIGKDYLLHDGKDYFEAKLEVGAPGWEIYKKYHELRAARKKESK